MLKHCLSLKIFIPNFVVFFVSLVVVIFCVRKMSFSVSSAKREFTPAGHCFIIHLPGGGQCPLVRDSKPIGLLEIPTSSQKHDHDRDRDRDSNNHIFNGGSKGWNG